MKRPVVLAASLALALLGRPSRADESRRVFESARQPHVAVSPSGAVFVVAGSGDAIHVASSSDGGRTFGAPVRVATFDKLMLGMRRGPRIAATRTGLIVTAIGTLGEHEGDVLAFRSTDGGATWQKPVRVNGQRRSAEEGLHALAAGPQGFACTWLDHRSKASEVWCATSEDGTTWTETLAYRSPDGHTCECCAPACAWSPEGELALAFRNWVQGARDYWLVRSKDGGKSFGDAAKLGEGSWPLNRCPMEGGALAPTGEAFLSIWVRAKEVFLAPAGKPEQSLGPGTQAVLAEGPGGAYALWLERRGGGLYALVPGARKPRLLAPDAGDPAVASSLDGKGPVVAVWERAGGVVACVLSPRK